MSSFRSEAWDGVAGVPSQKENLRALFACPEDHNIPPSPYIPPQEPVTNLRCQLQMTVPKRIQTCLVCPIRLSRSNFKAMC